MFVQVQTTQKCKGTLRVFVKVRLRVFSFQTAPMFKLGNFSGSLILYYYYWKIIYAAALIFLPQ